MLNFHSNDVITSFFFEFTRFCGFSVHILFRGIINRTNEWRRAAFPLYSRNKNHYLEIEWYQKTDIIGAMVLNVCKTSLRCCSTKRQWQINGIIKCAPPRHLCADEKWRRKFSNCMQSQHISSRFYQTFLSATAFCVCVSVFLHIFLSLGYSRHTTFARAYILLNFLFRFVYLIIILGVALPFNSQRAFSHNKWRVELFCFFASWLD